MIEQVAPNQTRFVSPGLAPDARGVALGRFLVVLLPSIDRVIGLFRGLSEEMSVDELLGALEILQVRTPLQSREFLVKLPVSNSYAADQMAAVAALAGGLSFTGSAKHFVAYRDTRGPLGYDVDSLYDGQGDYILYARDFVQAYVAERALSFRQLVFNLSLQKVRGDQTGGEEQVLLRVVRGLWRQVLSYLHRNDVACAAAACEVDDPGLTGDAERFFLIRCDGIPARMVRLFCQTPGIEVHRLRLENVAVELGYRHPVELSSCASIFDESNLYLFAGGRGQLDLVQTRPTFVAGASLVEFGAPPRRLEVVSLDGAEAEGISVPLRLVPAGGATPTVVAARLPRGQAPWLRKLVYLLPPQVLGSYRVSVTEDFVFLINEEGVEFIPLGEMFWSPAAGVMVPVGYQLVPRVHSGVLLQHLGASSEQVFFFCRQQPAPLQLERSAFEPLSRAALATTIVERPRAGLQETAPAGRTSPRLVNEPVGLFPLWGFSSNDSD